MWTKKMFFIVSRRSRKFFSKPKILMNKKFWKMKNRISFNMLGQNRIKWRNNYGKTSKNFKISILSNSTQTWLKIIFWVERNFQKPFWKLYGQFQSAIEFWKKKVAQNRFETVQNAFFWNFNWECVGDTCRKLADL